VSFFVHGKIYKFSKESLGVFDNKNKLRIWSVWLITSKRFDLCVLFLILLNSIFLGMMDYTDEENVSWQNQLVEKSEPVFTALFTIEAVVKIIAMGFAIGKGSYLSDAWNWLDFIVVITSLLNAVPSMQNISGLRTFRLFRPLRSLTALPSMRILVGTLLASVSQLGGIFGLAIFFFLIFAILGVSLWPGASHYRCRMTEFPINGDWVPYSNDTRICGGSRQCPAGWCGSLIEAYDQGFNITVDLHRDSSIKELNWGITNFDNIGSAFLTIFQCITMEGWTKVMYIFQDSQLDEAVSIFFIFCVVICSFFLLNLTIAVMLNKYEELDKSEHDSKHKNELRELGDSMGLPRALTDFIIDQDNVGLAKGAKRQNTVMPVKKRICRAICYTKVEMPKQKGWY